MMEVSLSDVVAVSPYFRLLNNITTRQKAIRWQDNSMRKHNGKVMKELNNLARIRNILLVIKYTNTKSWRYRIINRAFNELGNREKHLADIFGYCLKISNDKKVDIVEKKLLDNLIVTTKKRRVQDLQTRILLEIIEACNDKWLVVFNTLTVANDNMDYVFKKENRAFEKYILSMNYAIKKVSEKKDGKKYKTVGDYHTYFAVVEKGGQTGRLHFHVLHFCRYLPSDCCDPNLSRGTPDNRIIAGLRKYWKWGYSAPIAVRFNSSDNYARIGWRWPVKRIGAELEPIESSIPIKLARYLSKYITKANEERSFRWRVRMSKCFGQKIIAEALTRTPNHLLLSLMKMRHWRELETMGISFPITLTRRMALKMYLQRRSFAKSNMQISTTQKSLTRLKPQTSIVEQYRTLMRPKQKSSLRNTTSTQMQSSKSSAIFEITQIFKEALGRRSYGRHEVQARGVTRFG